MPLFRSFTPAALRHLPSCALILYAAAACPTAIALTISGSPFTLAPVGALYWFQPSATDSSGKSMVFNITNKPAWVTFNSSTGQLSGTPGSAAVGYYQGIVISVSDGTSTAALPPFFIYVFAMDASPPVVSGEPPGSVTAGSAYSFQPTVRDPAGGALSFGIRNKPSWATFNIHTGLLTGTPSSAEVGTYSNISIYATDGKLSGSTSAFSITVAPNSGAVTLRWTEPTEFNDGAPLTNLAGYRLYYGTSPSSLFTVVKLADASLSTYTIKNLGTATWYFGVTAYTTTGVESQMSEIVSKSVN